MPSTNIETPTIEEFINKAYSESMTIQGYSNYLKSLPDNYIIDNFEKIKLEILKRDEKTQVKFLSIVNNEDFFKKMYDDEETISNSLKTGVVNGGIGRINNNNLYFVIDDIEGVRNTYDTYRNGYTILSYYDYNSVETDNSAPIFSFVLPLPDGDISYDSSVSWDTEEEEAFNDFITSTRNNNLVAASANIAENVIEVGARHYLKDILDKTSIVSKGLQRRNGMAYNPNEQVYFNKVNFDSPSFTFTLVPKNQEDSEKYKIFVQLINYLMLPGTNNSTFNGVLKLLSTFSQSIAGTGFLGSISKIGEWTHDLLSSGLEKISKEVKELYNSGDKNIFGGNPENNTSKMHAPFFAYPGLWSIDIYTITSELKANNVLYYKRLVMNSAKLKMGANNNLTWHTDGAPTEMKLDLEFQETVYKTKENYGQYSLVLGDQIKETSKYVPENKKVTEKFKQSFNGEAKYPQILAEAAAVSNQIKELEERNKPQKSEQPEDQNEKFKPPSQQNGD